MSIWIDLKELFFPRSCIVCNEKLLPDEAGVCTSCLLRLPYTRIGHRPGNRLEQLFWGRFPIEQASALFTYARQGEVAQILYAMKYHHRPRLCVEMGRLMAHEWQGNGFFQDIDWLLPVPLHPQRQRERGYNQSERLAAGISQVTGIPVCTTALVRSRNNLSQTHKSASERWENTQTLFQLAPDARPLLEGRHILLLDDVITTGATLTACADALKDLPGIRFSVAALSWSHSIFFGT